MRNSNSWRRTMYREKIAKLAPGYDPAHVEAWMRTAHSRGLDAMSSQTFASEVKVACQNIDEGGLDMADSLAELEGLRPKPRQETT